MGISNLRAPMAWLRRKYCCVPVIASYAVALMPARALGSGLPLG